MPHSSVLRCLFRRSRLLGRRLFLRARGSAALRRVLQARIRIWASKFFAARTRPPRFPSTSAQKMKPPFRITVFSGELKMAVSAGPILKYFSIQARFSSTNARSYSALYGTIFISRFFISYQIGSFLSLLSSFFCDLLFTDRTGSGFWQFGRKSTKKRTAERCGPLTKKMPKSGRGGRTRTCDQWFRKPLLYPLSYAPVGLENYRSIYDIYPIFCKSFFSKSRFLGLPQSASIRLQKRGKRYFFAASLST